jgi:hypothetical protein
LDTTFFFCICPSQKKFVEDVNFCPSGHCEERSDEAISWFIEWLWDCFASLWPPMTNDAFFKTGLTLHSRRRNGQPPFGAAQFDIGRFIATLPITNENRILGE